MNVTFKYIGQGDSIILVWNDSGLVKVGIIDCNNHNGSILTHIKSLGSSIFIEFIVLSHPHDDHFSGLLDLILYLNDNNIPINYFFHTCASNKHYFNVNLQPAP